MTESMSTGVRGNSIDRTTTTVSIKCVDLRGLDQHGANIKIFYCSSLEELQINMDEYEREFNNPGDGTKPAAIFKRYN